MSDANPKTLYFAVPAYTGCKPSVQAVTAAFLGHAPLDRVYYQEGVGSSTTFRFNQLWCDALNKRRSHRITHFLMLHTDIAPLAFTWVEDLLREMARVKADVLSVVIPFKDDSGLTSTAVSGGNPDPFHPVRRITMTEAENLLRPTFTDDKLLINTGMMLVDFTKPWVEQVHFEFKDEIRQAPDGTFYPVGVSEDYNFSRQLIALGVPRHVTNVVKAIHQGSYEYPNFGKWGTMKRDEEVAQVR